MPVVALFNAARLSDTLHYRERTSLLGQNSHVKLGFTAPLGLVGNPVNGHVPDYFNVGLMHDASFTSTTNLLEQFAPGLPFIGDSSNLRFDIDDSIEVRFKLDDFSVVPEPAAETILSLFVTGHFIIRRTRPVTRPQQPDG